MDTIKQGATLVANVSFQFSNPSTGRKVTVRSGQKFWVTNSESDQAREQVVRIDRLGKGCISHGWPFSIQSAMALFSHDV